MMLNIEHYRNLLRSECDSTKRTTILKLLAEEETNLAGLRGVRPSNSFVPGSPQPEVAHSRQ
jgi:hypothetical protein